MLAKSTARNLMVFLTDSADHVTGKNGGDACHYALEGRRGVCVCFADRY